MAGAINPSFKASGPDNSTNLPAILAGAENLRCKCGKIIAQINGNDSIIKCRHCKRYVIIKTQGIIDIKYES